MEFINNIVLTKSSSSSSCRIKGVLYDWGKIVNDIKCVGNVINKNFVNTADKLLKEKKDVVDVKNDGYCFVLEKKGLFLMNIPIVRLRIM